MTVTDDGLADSGLDQTILSFPILAIFKQSPLIVNPLWVNLADCLA